MTKPISASTLSAGQPQLKVRGSLLRRDDITASSVNVFGHLNARGKVTAAELKVSGECSIAGHCYTGRTENLGSLRVHSLKSDHIRSTGYLSATNEISTLTFLAKGAIRLNTLYAAKSVEIILGSPCTADQIRTEGSVTIKRFSGMLNALMGPLRKLSCRHIQGDIVNLEHTTARLVSGRDIRIGPGCDIQEIRYSASLKVSGNAKVGASVFSPQSGEIFHEQHDR